MLINRKVLSLPPHISTSWGHITALTMREGVLRVVLNDGTVIDIPRLSQSVVEQIFTAHAAFLEEASQLKSEPAETTLFHSFEFPLQTGFSGVDGLTAALQHDEEQANAPNLPEELIEKVSSIARMAGLNELSQLPKAEPHCNCPHCQIARAMHGITPQHQQPEENALQEPLLLSTEKIWKVEECDENLYTVTNKTDPSEVYKVYLGKEVGCNCGVHGCEHILAVLRS